jgi:hypothetical protein
MFNAKEIANIILHVVLVASFIGVFYFTYASKVEENVVKRQVAYMVNNIGYELQDLPEHTKNKMKKSLENVNLNLEKADDIVQQNNKKLLIFAAEVLGGLLVAGFLIVFFMSRIYKFSFYELLKENLIILVFVAITEFSFLTFLAQKFMSVDTQEIKQKLVNIVQGK